MDNGDYATAHEWYEELCRIAREHQNLNAVVDRVAWVEKWKTKSPAQAYWDKYKSGLVLAQ